MVCSTDTSYPFAARYQIPPLVGDLVWKKLQRRARPLRIFKGAASQESPDLLSEVVDIYIDMNLHALSPCPKLKRLLAAT
jgi:hypothetical protein